MWDVTQISYKRVYNLGNYESEHLEITASVEAGDDPGATLDEMRAWCHSRRWPVDAQGRAVPQPPRTVEARATTPPATARSTDPDQPF